jgi:putative transposase
MLQETGATSVKLPARSPNLNAYAERFVRTIKESCMERVILFGEDSVRRAASEFIVHYHRERNHQGLDNRLISPDPKLVREGGEVKRRERLGGLLNYYYRAAA